MIDENIKNKEFQIIDLDDKARGIAKSDGLIYFIENAKLGEIVKIEILKDKKKYIEAKKIETVRKSPFLIEKNISENSLCGIFDLYDIKYKKQVEYKKDLIINTINRISNEKLKDIEFVEASQRYNYRNKIELKVSSEGKLSFFARNSNDNIFINDCIMASKEINSIIPKLQEIIDRFNLKGYDSNSNQGLIKNIILRSTYLGDVMGILVFNEFYDFKDFYNELENMDIFDSFYVSYNNKSRNYKILDLHHVFGKKKITEEMGDFKFNISPKAFFQVNRDIAYKIYLKAKSYVEEINPEFIIDMYSGVSTTSIILSDLSKNIISVEINEDAIKDAMENAQINNINNIEWINKPAEKAIEEIELNKKNSVVLFDPPRRGLESNIIEKIGNSEINNIVYISCNPATLARDIKRFKEYGFELIEVSGFDQFVNTIEVEVVCYLRRN